VMSSWTFDSKTGVWPRQRGGASRKTVDLRSLQAGPILAAPCLAEYPPRIYRAAYGEAAEFRQEAPLQAMAAIPQVQLVRKLGRGRGCSIADSFLGRTERGR